MMKRVNKIFIFFSISLFVIGIILAQTNIIFRSDNGAVLGEKQIIEEPEKTDAESLKSEDLSIVQGQSSSLDLFLNQNFLGSQEQLFKESDFFATRQIPVEIFNDLAPPQNIQVWDVKNGKMVTITWDGLVNQKSRIKILRSTIAGKNEKLIAEVDGKAIGYYDTDVKRSDTYYYTFAVVLEDGSESEPIGPYQIGPVQDLTSPSSPTDIAAAMSADGVRIAWKNPTDDDLAFVNIYRSREEGQLGKRIARIRPSLAQEFLDSSYESGVVYYYLVVSEDSAGNESKYNLIGDKLGNPNPFTAIQP